MTDRTLTPKELAFTGGVIARSPGGRPTILTDELTNKICGHVANGCDPRISGQLEKVSGYVVGHWIKMGLKAQEKPEGEWTKQEANCVEFLLRIQESDALYHAGCITDNRRHGKLNPQALQWTMGHKWPEVWGDRQAIDITGNVNLTVSHEVIDHAKPIDVTPIPIDDDQ